MQEAYNDYLYRKRKEAHLRRKEVASSLGVSKFLYHRYERGYSIPTQEVVKKISDLYGEDFSPYLEGEASYPSEIKEKGERAFWEKVRNAFKKRWVKLLAVLLPAISLLNIPAAVVSYHMTDDAYATFYDDHYERIRAKTVELGTPYSDPLGNFNQSIVAYETWIEDDAFFGLIKAPVNPVNIGEMAFSFTYRDYDFSENPNDPGELYRLEYKRGRTFSFSYMDNQSGEYVVQSGERIDEFEYRIDKNDTNMSNPDEVVDYTLLQVAGILGDFFFQALLSDDFEDGYSPFVEEDGLAVSDFYQEVFLVKARGDEKIEIYDGFYCGFAYIGTPIAILLSGLNILFFVLSREKEEKAVPIEGKEPLPPNKRLPFFVGSSAYRVFGSILLLIGSLYILIGLASRFSLTSLVLKRIDGASLLALATSVFFLGVFYLYIIGLRDDFDHPKRLYFRTILFGTIGVAISFAQYFFALSLSYYENRFAMLLLSYMPSNIFISIFWFHLCAMFLFTLPKIIKGKWAKLWRWCSIIPPLLSLILFITNIVTTHFLGKPVEIVSYFFGANRFPYAFVTYCFLFGNYFLRNYFAKRYGEAYLRGDQYSLYKNLTISIPALVIGGLELILFFVPGARAYGFGESIGLLLVAVTMFFYRGYNDKEHLWALIVARSVYGLGIINTYTVTIALAVVFMILA